MRIARIELVRFGKFTDRAIDLPSTTPDLHLIYGPNEAGKSTFRAALADLLFGFEFRTPYDFIHPYRDLCLAAAIERDGERLAFRRLKRNRDSLRDADGRPLPEDQLIEFLGAVDRGFFARMFALDRRKLEDGGLEVLRAKDDLGRMLFEASAGLPSFGVLRQQLEEEADGLWAPRRKQGRAYYAALDQFEDAERRLREVSVRARQWHEAKQRVDDLGQELQAAVDRHLQLERERARLDRIRRVAPHLLSRKELMEDRATLGDVVSFPADAAAELRSARVAIAAAQTVISQQQTLIERAEAERARITVDQALLGRRKDVIALGEERNRVRDHAADIEKRRAELELLRTEAAALVREIGWTLTSEDELAERMPSRVAREEVLELLAEHARLSEQRRLTIETRDGTNQELDELECDLAAIPDRPLPAGLMAAREAVRGLGDFAAQRRHLQQMLDKARQKLAAATDDLAPWSGPIESLKGMQLPGEEEAQRIASRADEIDGRLRTLRTQLADARRNRDEKRLTEAQIRRQRQPPTAEAIVAARAGRDSLWADIRHQRVGLAVVAETYEARVSEADTLADGRYLAAADAEQLELLSNDLELIDLKIGQLETAAKEFDSERHSLDADWIRMLPEGLMGLAPAAFPGWLKRRRHALGELDQVASATSDSTAFEDAVSEAFAALGLALSAVGLDSSGDSALTPAALLALADKAVSEAEEARTRREELTRQLAKLKRNLAVLNTRAGAADMAMQDWQRRWEERLRSVRLPPGLAPGAARTAIDVLSRLAEKLDRMRELQRARIVTMQRDLEVYCQKARALAASLAPELVGAGAEKIVADLSNRLTEAEKAKEREDRATAELADARKAMAEARSRKERAEAKLIPLIERAGTRGLEDLGAAIERSERAAATDAEIGRVNRLILESGDGLSLAELEAEVAAEELSSITARLAEVDRLREDARSGREQSLLAMRAAEAELAAINGAPEAAKAEACRQEALAEMAAATGRYVSVFVAARLLRWAIERFRAEKQDPLLRHAAETFRGLTLDGFVDLTIDYDGDTPHLLGCRAEGAHVAVDGMSEGTRDQLYLALRLAAIELHLQNARPLPFVADDLFVNFDDDRAAAGFRALAKLAEKTQVIFLSHHAHLVDVAQEAIGDGLNIVSL